MKSLAKRYDSSSITEGTIWKALLAFFFPILFGTFFQQLYNTIDAIVVGRFVGKEALAAVGGGSAVFVNLIVGFFIGLTSGAGVIISQFYGARQDKNLSLAVNTAMGLCMVCGILMTVLGACVTDTILNLIKTPSETFQPSRLYLRIYFLGMLPMSIYNMGSGILRAVGNSRTPLAILIIGCGTNIVLDIILVMILKMGVAGVALATVICQIESAAITLVILTRTKDTYRLSFRDISFSPRILYRMLKIGFPAGIQSSLYTISNLIIQTCINAFGTNLVAAWAAFGKLDAVFWMMISALGISITTFSGQNYGALRYDRMTKGIWQSLVIASIFTAIFSSVFLIFGRSLLSLFTTDKQVIEEGLRIIRFIVPFWITYISIEIISGTIRGTGNSLVPMIITVFGVCLLRIVWLFTAVPLRNNIITVISSYPITWIITSIMFWIYYFSGKWLNSKSFSHSIP